MNINKAVGAGPSGDWQTLFQTGFVQIDQGNLKSAESIFSSVLPKVPANERRQVAIQIDLLSLFNSVKKAQAFASIQNLLTDGQFGKDVLLRALLRWEPRNYGPRYILGLKFYNDNNNPQSDITLLGSDFIVECARGNYTPAFYLAGKILVEDRMSIVDGLMYWKMARKSELAATKLNQAMADPNLSKYMEDAENRLKSLSHVSAMKPLGLPSTGSVMPVIPPPQPSQKQTKTEK